MRRLKSKLASVDWRQLLVAAAIACGAALVAADGALPGTLRDGAAVAFLAFATLAAVRATNEYRAATALHSSEPSYTFDGRWPTGFWSWLRNGLEGALQAAELRAGAGGTIPDLLVCGPGRGNVAPPLRRTARLVVGVRTGDGIPATVDPSQFRQLQQRQWHLMLYIARRGTELRAYLVDPEGRFTLIPGGASDDIFFAEIRQRLLEHLRQTPEERAASAPESVRLSSRGTAVDPGGTGAAHAPSQTTHHV